MLKSLNCPNCSAPYNPANLTCPFCGSYILNSDADEADYQKETFVQQEQRPANYKGIYLYGRLWHKHVDKVLDEILEEADRLMCWPMLCEDDSALVAEIRLW